jgi:hypothetical protein
VKSVVFHLEIRRIDAAQDGLWKIKGKRQVIHARNDLSAADRLKAARQIVEGGQ